MMSELLDDGGPTAYARRLARYISDPSTIRIRTMEYYGRAPSIHDCRRYREAHLRSIDRYKKLSEERGSLEWGREWEDDGEPWRPRVIRNEWTKLVQECKASKERKAIEAAELERLKALELLSLDERARKTRSHGDLVQAVAARFDLGPKDVTGPSRRLVHVRIRRLVMAILHKRGHSYAQIGRWLGGRDHSTVIYNVTMFHDLSDRHPDLMEVYRYFTEPETSEGAD